MSGEENILNGSGQFRGEVGFGQIIAEVGIAIAVVDREFRFLCVNPKWSELFGYSPLESGGMTVLDVTDPEDSDSTRLRLGGVLSGEHPFLKVEKRLVRKDRSIFWGEILLTPWRGASGEIAGIIGTIQDISEKKLLRDQLLNLKNLYAGSTEVHQLLLRRPDLRLLFQEVSRIGVAYGGFVASWIVFLNDDRNLVKVALSTLDPKLEALLENVEISVDPGDPSGIGSVGESIRTGRPVCINDFLSNPRTEFWRERAVHANVRSVASFPLRKQEEIVGALVVLSDREGYFHGEVFSLLCEISESLSFALDDVFREEQRSIASTVFKEALEGIIITDLSGKILMVNSAFSEITGYSPEEVIGRSPSILRSGRHDRKFFAELWDCLGRTGGWQGELWNRRKNGAEYLQQLSIVGSRNREDRLSHYIGFMADITSRREEENRIRKLAYHDPLTGLPNRALFQDRLEQAVRISRRTGHHVGLCYLDLDAFKPVNDHFGHQAGDDLLREISCRLGNILRESDTVCRVGGDEFVLLFPELPGPEELIRLGGVILETVSRPFEWGDFSITVTCSIGLAIFPEDGEDFPSLLTKADHSMYQAKKTGKNRAFWQP